MKKKSLWFLYPVLTIVCCILWFNLPIFGKEAAPGPGWKRFGSANTEQHNIELWLPSHYEGVDPAIVEFIMTLYADKIPAEYLIVNADDVLSEVKIVLAARDTRQDNQTPDVLVSYRVLTPSAEIKLSPDEATFFFEPYQYANLIEAKTISLRQFEALRLIYDITVEDRTTRLVQYFILNNSNLWSIMYMPLLSDYDNDLSNFEQSAQTFNIKP